MKKSGVCMHMNTEVTRDLIEGLKTLLKEGNVKIMTHTSLKQVTEDGVIVESDRLCRRSLRNR
ncbi:MAG TPA: hypothetical protein DIW07_11335 [Lachnospiraceae bacterium]|jgi:NADH dehydrogenase FAD-containing subunit|nr:hypothetical protein [Lachnospiraceae bacterium]HCR83980.1 hypothetical protein [Lachnospiraceae bacterium]